MALKGNLIAVIGRLHPASYDLIFPHGPVVDAVHAARHSHGHGYRDDHGYVALNPQPLPPRQIFAGFETGAAVGHEVVRAAGVARAFGIELRFDVVDICPPPKPWPPLPWPFPWPPRTYPWRTDELGPEFDTGYALGLGAVLEATAEVWEQLPAAGFLEQLYDAASEIALVR